MVSQKTLHPMMQKMEIRFTSLSELRSLDSSALHPDLRILWNTSIFHRIAYQLSFSMAALSDLTGQVGDQLPRNFLTPPGCSSFQRRR